MSGPAPIPADAHLMIIGAMKCGTSSLYDYLLAHPAIAPCRVKEPEFFSRHQAHGVRPRPRRYAELWAFDPARHRYALEASTGYTKYPYEPDVPERIREAGLNPRLIYLVRDPIERIESHHRFIAGSTTQRLPAADYTAGMLDACRYASQLERYTRCFPRERLLVLDMALLRQRPALPLRERLAAFLGLDPAPWPAQVPVLHDTDRLPAWDGWLRRLPGWGFCERRLPRPVAALRGALARRWPAPRLRLSEAQRHEIREALQGEMRQLARDHGIDVRAWGFSA